MFGACVDVGDPDDDPGARPASSVQRRDPDPIEPPVRCVLTIVVRAFRAGRRAWARGWSGLARSGVDGRGSSRLSRR